MFRKLALAAILAAAAFPALAETAVTVNLAGLDAKAAHAAILHAAQVACRAELSDQSDTIRFYTRPACIQSAATTAEAKYLSMRGLASR
jgi:hypothetical protein